MFGGRQQTGVGSGGWTQGQRRFAQTPSANVPRSVFNRSCGHKTTFDAGNLIPVFVDEALPGDTFNMRARFFGRLATPIFPVMDNFYLDTFWFFVPYRLLWENWEKFNGAQDDPGDSTAFTIPQFDYEPVEGSNFDYMGIPVNGVDVEFSALPSRALALIWNEWFRDENLQDSAPFVTTDAAGDPADYETVYKRGKRHDYFSSSLPFAQKGTAIELPLGSTAPVTGTGVIVSDGSVPNFTGSTSGVGPLVATAGNVGVGGSPPVGNLSFNSSFIGIEVDADAGGMVTDLSSATSASINAIRQAFQIQKLLERDARGGTRYTEIVRSHFGVVSPDQRLQRPEYLGGGSQRVNVTPIPNTNEDGSPLGNLGGYGTVGDVNGFVKSFTEHGVVLGLVNVRADITYQQGLERFWSRQTRYDFYWPALGHIGEQAVLNKEIFYNNDAADEDVWGYQERYAEYRYKPSRVSGAFRSNAATPLDSWHLALDFATRPALNDVFIEDDPPFDRVIAVATEPHFLLDSWFQFKNARPMSTYGVPGLIDHF